MRRQLGIGSAWERTRGALTAQTLVSRRQLAIAAAGAAGLMALGRSREKTAARAASGRVQTVHENMLIYYGADHSTVDPRYSLIVLDDHGTATIAPFRYDSSVILCYLSLLEVHATRPYFAQLRASGVLGGSNPNWPDAYFVDAREHRFHALVLEELIPRMIARGYSGIFLDTVDSAEFLETTQAESYSGILQATANLIAAIRREHPSMLVMINRGYAVLPRIPGQFDYLLGESVHSTFGPNGTYRRMSAEDLQWQLAHMHAARARDPKLQLFSLDYWDPQDAEGLKALYAQARGNGLVPYVATPDLTRIVPEP